ncbi:MAG: hypothetical protein V4473_00700 [Patescibacteria group bacterium]
MDKQIFTKNLREWLEEFLTKKFSSEYDIEAVLIPETSLSKMNHESIKQIPNYSAFEFKPDVLGVLKEKKSGKLELVLLNRSTSALSLKELGEMNCYARLTGAFLAMVASLNGVSNEVSILLLEDSIRSRVLKYDESRSLLVFGWDEKNNRINKDSIIPFEQKDFLAD